MATIALKGREIHTSGSLPIVGTQAPDFRLTKSDLSDVHRSDFPGKVLVLNIVPSLDTGTCAASARAFERKIKALGGIVVLTVSRDLPFAQSRFCQAEKIESVITLSELRDRDFGTAYGVEIVDGPMAGLLSRAVVVIGKDGKIAYTQQVPEISAEPNYDAALAAAQKLL